MLDLKVRGNLINGGKSWYACQENLSVNNDSCTNSIETLNVYLNISDFKYKIIPKFSNTLHKIYMLIYSSLFYLHNKINFFYNIHLWTINLLKIMPDIQWSQWARCTVCSNVLYRYWFSIQKLNCICLLFLVAFMWSL